MVDHILQTIFFRRSHAVSGVQKVEEFLFTVRLENLLGKRLLITS